MSRRCISELLREVPERVKSFRDFVLDIAKALRHKLLSKERALEFLLGVPPSYVSEIFDGIRKVNKVVFDETLNDMEKDLSTVSKDAWPEYEKVFSKIFITGEFPVKHASVLQFFKDKEKREHALALISLMYHTGVTDLPGLQRMIDAYRLK